MKTKRLFNTSAYKTSKILERVLRDTDFRLYPELALSVVLDVDRDSLSQPERNTLNKGSFDFVVYNEESFPEFAVEFDGPYHQTYETKIQADIRKNRLCFKAGLPLLRINDDFLTEYEKSSLLEYVVRRFIDWRNSRPQITEEESDIARFLGTRGATEEEYEQMMDPQIMWDLQHPFPASLQLAEALYSTYGVVNNHIDAEVYEKALEQSEFLFFQRERTGSAPIGLYHYKVEGTYELRRMVREDSGKYKAELIHLVPAAVTYQWRLPTVDLARVDTSKELIVEHVHGQELPGISGEELANHFCDFLALNQLKIWAEQNLRVVESNSS